MSVGDSTPRGGEVPHVEMRDFPTGPQGRPDECPGRLGRRTSGGRAAMASAIRRRIQREREAAVLAAAARQSSLRRRLPARRPMR
jgi:hypothetical protein